jgi:hypothetical protein
MSLVPVRDEKFIVGENGSPLLALSIACGRVIVSKSDPTEMQVRIMAAEGRKIPEFVIRKEFNNLFVLEDDPNRKIDGFKTDDLEVHIDLPPDTKFEAWLSSVVRVQAHVPFSVVHAHVQGQSELDFIATGMTDIRAKDSANVNGDISGNCKIVAANYALVRVTGKPFEGLIVHQSGEAAVETRGTVRSKYLQTATNKCLVSHEGAVGMACTPQ